MSKWRKKAITVEAWQWTFCEEQETPPQWVEDAMCHWPELGSIAFWPDGLPGDPQPRIEISTLEGVMRAVPGDWIIQGVHGELYPCKPDIFEQTYEEAQ